MEQCLEVWVGRVAVTFGRAGEGCGVLGCGVWAGSCHAPVPWSLGCPGSLGMRGVGGSGVTKMQTPLSLVFIKNYLNDTESFVFIRLIFINCDYFILLTCSHFMC